MSALDDLIKLVQDDELRGRLKAEFDKIRKRKKYGLVFESKEEFATLPNRVVKLGDPVYPTLTKLDEVCNAPEDNLWHVLIEAENYHALQLLKYLYAGKVDCIYIDPPYNTGARDWKYNDNYVDAADNFRHSKWLSMMERRLKLAKELLSDSGAIFISIDDNEQATLKLLCDDIFGVNNFVAQFSWKRKKEISNDSQNVSTQGEYILCYSKTVQMKLNRESLSDESIKKSYRPPTKDFPLDYWRTVPITVSKGLSGGGYEYAVTTPSGAIHKKIWAYPQRRYEELASKGRIYFGKNGNAIPMRVMYLSENNGKPTSNFWDNVTTNREGKKELLDIFGDNVFQTPKPTHLIEKILRLATNENSLVLDFFAGSGTTLHAVNLLNAEDGGNRRCILVTNNEVSDAEEKNLRKQELTPADDAWQALGIARHVTWQRTVCSIEGHDINGTPLSGNYLGTDLPMADGFKANAVFFKLDYLDRDNVALGKSFKELLPVLWLKAGGIGKCPTLDAEEPFKIFAANRFAVLLDEKRFKEFAEALRGVSIDTVFIVTGSKTALNRMRKLSNVPQSVQLYGDYLKHFKRKEVTR